jgi:glucan biosynthesis protein C
VRERRYDVDWLRVLAMLVVFIYHSGRFFNLEWWHLKNAQLSFGVTVFSRVVDQWMMPLFFILSGVGTWYALGHRNGPQYAFERVKRLFVPLAFGTLVIIPPQVYLERIDKAQFHGSYFQFYPHFFSGVYPAGNFSWHHLWFLAYLFVLSLIALPLLLTLRHGGGQGFMSAMRALCDWPGGIFLLAIPVAIIRFGLGPISAGLQTLYGDWANLLAYLTLFIYGFILYSDDHLNRAIQKHWKVAAAGAIGMTAFLAFIILRFDPHGGYTPAGAGMALGEAFSSWFWLIAILGAGQRYLSFRNTALDYANEAVLPFYVLHQTVIIIVGYYVIQWPLGVPAKYAITASVAFALTLGAYDILVRRWNVTRVLFGMRQKRRRRPVTEAGHGA